MVFNKDTIFIENYFGAVAGVIFSFLWPVLFGWWGFV